MALGDFVALGDMVGVIVKVGLGDFVALSDFVALGDWTAHVLGLGVGVIVMVALGVFAGLPVAQDVSANAIAKHIRIVWARILFGPTGPGHRRSVLLPHSV